MLKKGRLQVRSVDIANYYAEFNSNVPLTGNMVSKNEVVIPNRHYNHYICLGENLPYVDVDCQDGYSSTWGSEYSSSRGTAIGQVMSEVGGSLTQEECKNKCALSGSKYYNWMYQSAPLNTACRCYSEVQGNSLTIVGTGWKFCSVSGNCCGPWSTFITFRIER
eukprot:Awhi_evm1s3509